VAPPRSTGYLPLKSKRSAESRRSPSCDGLLELPIGFLTDRHKYRRLVIEYIETIKERRICLKYVLMGCCSEVALEKIFHRGVFHVGVELAGFHMVGFLYWELELASIDKDVVRESSHDAGRHEVCLSYPNEIFC